MNGIGRRLIWVVHGTSVMYKSLMPDMRNRKKDKPKHKTQLFNLLIVIKVAN